MSKEEEPQRRGIALRQDELSSYRQGNSYFLGIGIDEYEHLRPLSNAVADVKAVRDTLFQKFDFEEPVVLINRQATKKAIVNKIATYYKALTTEDRLVIYFAGHSLIDGPDPTHPNVFWAPVDAHRDDHDSIISGDQVKFYLRKSQAKHIFLISDSCYSAGFFDSRATPQEKKTDLDWARKVEKIKSRWALFSGRDSEVVSDGIAGQHSPFTNAILEFLRLEEKAPFINVGYLVDQVSKLANNYNSLQTASGESMYDCGHEKHGQLIFWSREQKVPIHNIGRQTKERSINVILEKVKRIQSRFQSAQQAEHKKEQFFLAYQLQKEHPKHTAVNQLVNDILQAVEQEERTLFLKEQGKSNRTYQAALQNIIHLFTEQNLKMMENYLRKSCELMLHDLEIPVLENRWTLRDFCEKKITSLQRWIHVSQSLEENAIHLQVGSEILYEGTQILKEKIDKELDLQDFSFLSESFTELNKIVVEQIRHVKLEAEKWGKLVDDPEQSADPDTAFQNHLEIVISHLQFLEEIFELVYSKTFAIEYSLS